MLFDKSLSTALAISLLLHAAIILPLKPLRNLGVEKELSLLKISYFVLEEPRQQKSATVKPLPSEPIKAVEHKEDKTEAAASVPQAKAVERKISVPQPVSQYRKVQIPPDLPKEKEVAYLNYYQTIRAKIHQIAVLNYPRFIACGEVCLYFVLSPNGQLKEIKILEEKSTSHRLLKEIAMKSVQEAAPFLVFPKDLNQPQLSFNVSISFELAD